MWDVLVVSVILIVEASFAQKVSGVVKVNVNTIPASIRNVQVGSDVKNVRTERSVYPVGLTSQRCQQLD